MTESCPACVASRAARTARPSHRSAGLAFALTAVPGLGHAYAGAFGRAVLGFFVGAPALLALVGTETIPPLAGLGLLGLFALDAYRTARARNGEWSERRSGDLRSALIALVLAFASVGIAREAGYRRARPTMAIPVFMIVYGASLAWPEKRRPAATPAAPVPIAGPPRPGETIDRRVSREELAASFAGPATGAPFTTVVTREVR